MRDQAFAAVEAFDANNLPACVAARVAKRTGRPAKVATDQYRKGWEAIWAKKRPNRELN